MKLYKLIKANSFDISPMLIATGRFDYSQASEISEQLIRKFYVYKKTEVKSAGAIWRFSILFYWVAYLLLLILMAFKWLFTGKFYFEYDKSPVITFMQKWGHKLGLNV